MQNRDTLNVECICLHFELKRTGTLLHRVSPVMTRVTLWIWARLSRHVGYAKMFVNFRQKRNCHF